MGDADGIAALNAMHAKDKGYLKFLVAEARSNIDMTAHTEILPMPREREREEEQPGEIGAFGIDVWTCHCGGRRTVRAIVTNRATAAAMLQSMGLAPTPQPASQSPPQLSLSM